MAFVWDKEASDIENIKSYVEYIIQSIENHDASTERVKGDLEKLRDTLRSIK